MSMSIEQAQQNKYETYPGSLYSYTHGHYCGVLITEPVMKKLAKLQAAYLADVKRLLTDEAERDNVYPSMWTLHHPNGKQTHVSFIETEACVFDRIKNATTADKPIHKPLVFVASDMQEAKYMADARFALIGGEDE